MTRQVLIVGQGYVGLPIAMRAVQVGYQVVGLDNDPRRIHRLQTGDSFVEDVSDTELQAALATGLYSASTDCVLQELAPTSSAVRSAARWAACRRI